MKQYVDELIRRGRLSGAWVADQVDEDGCIPANGNLGCYYKCVYPLRAAGHSDKSAKVLNKIMQLHYTGTGDLRNSDEKKNFRHLYVRLLPGLSQRLDHSRSASSRTVRYR